MDIIAEKQSLLKLILVYLLTLIISLNAIVAFGLLGMMISRLFSPIHEILSIVIMMVFVIVSLIIGVITFIKLRQYFGKVLEVDFRSTT